MQHSPRWLVAGDPERRQQYITAHGIGRSALCRHFATMDDYIRAFDQRTGEELWKGRLPAGGQATPMTYQWKGRQYVVIAAGGHSAATTTLGDYVLAYALPE